MSKLKLIVLNLIVWELVVWATATYIIYPYSPVIAIAFTVIGTYVVTLPVKKFLRDIVKRSNKKDEEE